MKTRTSNIFVGISMMGGIAHVLLYTNHFWNDIFWLTGPAAIIMPLVIRRSLKNKKIAIRPTRKTIKTEQIKEQVLDPTLVGNCKNCGEPTEISVTYCSQNCEFEHFLNKSNAKPQKKFQIPN